MSEYLDPIHSVECVGPFDRYVVIVNGWTVPHLDARATKHGVSLTLDNRLGLDLNEETTPGQIISFIADCIAVAKGYASHPRKDGWEDEDRINPPQNPLWPWRHMQPLGSTGFDVEDLP